jgi:hypothetical protein
VTRDRHASVHSSRSPVPWPTVIVPSSTVHEAFGTVRHFLVMSLDLPYTPRRAVYGDCNEQQHRTRSTKLGAPSLWEVIIDPLDTPEGRSGAASEVRVLLRT